MTNHLKKDYWSPYIAGALIGLLQIPVFFIEGSLGSSGSLQSTACALQTFIAENFEKISGTCFLNQKSWWQLGFVLGIILGAFISKKLSGTPRKNISPFWKQTLSNYSDNKRYIMAFSGGFLFLLGARIADGCTMGNGVSGISLLSVGSFVVVLSMFIAGIFAARFYKS